MPNRLANETSPYLLQHANNPVDWYPWSPEALERAKRENKPILLSIGYAACHWCHVMEHESFEDPTTAAVMNEHFVNIKVDREERPDIDGIYMQAVQAMTGHGGWPMTMFLLPDGRPFYGGAYFPPDDRHGLPSFRQVLQAVDDAYSRRREGVAETAEQLRAIYESNLAPARSAGRLNRELFESAYRNLAERYDAKHGGFGGPPKFPATMALDFLLRYSRRTDTSDALAMVLDSYRKMARGGIYDQVGGGFARYSVDAQWLVPHFEKMLYDNALLLRLYTHLALRTGSARHREVASQTAEFLLRRLRTPEGGFAASLDADTDGVEGLTYAWTPDQLTEVLGEDDGAWAAELLGVTAAGTFEHGTSTLRMLREPEVPARWTRIRERLLIARDARPQPGRDDKVVTAWNGLVIGALAYAGAAFGVPDWTAAATAAAELVTDLHLVDARL